MDSLRLILILLGIVLVAGVYLYHRRPFSNRGKPAPEHHEPGGPPKEEGAEASAANEAGELIVVLTLMAGEGYHFAGSGVIDALEGAGLFLGKRRVFQLEEETASGPSTVFTVANILEPGVFPDGADFSTPGLALLLRLPGPLDGREAFKRMLGIAKTLADQLGGELCDEARHPLSRQKAAYLYEQIRDHEWRRKAPRPGRARGGR